MSRPRASRARSGFSMIELLIVVVVVAILATLAIPQLQHAVARARASKVLADVATIRLAAHEALAKDGAFPPQANFGVVPAKLAPHLPPGFKFKKGHYQYRWRLFPAPSSPFGVATGRIAVQLLKSDPRLLDALTSMGNQELMVVQTDRVHFWVLP